MNMSGVTQLLNEKSSNLNPVFNQHAFVTYIVALASLLTPCCILSFFFKIYLFMAVLGLCFCARAFSTCGKRGPLFIAVRGPLTIRPLLLRSTGSRRAGSVVVAHGPSCSVACGIFPDRGPNPCPLHWQADLNHCATREALSFCFISYFTFYISLFVS